MSVDVTALAAIIGAILLIAGVLTLNATTVGVLVLLASFHFTLHWS